MLKDPSDVLDYAVDWSRWLTDGDTVTASTWDVPAGLTKGADSHASGKATVWLSGGTAGQQYVVTNHITTTQGRQADKSLTVNVRNR